MGGRIQGFAALGGKTRDLRAGKQQNPVVFRQSQPTARLGDTGPSQGSFQGFAALGGKSRDLRVGPDFDFPKSVQLWLTARGFDEKRGAVKGQVIHFSRVGRLQPSPRTTESCCFPAIPTHGEIGGHGPEPRVVSRFCGLGRKVTRLKGRPRL